MTADCVGGVWTYALQLCAALAEQRVEVALCVMGGKPSEAQLAEARNLSNVSIVSHDLKLEWMPDAEADLRLAAEFLLDLEASFQPDLVHVNGYHLAAAGFQRPVVLVAHSCVPTWWLACRGEALPAEWDGYRRGLRAGLAAANAIVAPSRSYLAQFEEIHGAQPKARVILNGRSADDYAPAEKREVVLAAGRVWDEAKNISTLCEAARGLRYPVLIAGEGEIDATACANTVALGRLGSRELAVQMATAAVFAAPARCEPFGLAVLEAALSGCALVLGDIPTFRELWSDAALFVDPSDSQGLRRCLDTLLSDPKLLRRMGMEARQRALRYGAEEMGRHYMDLYATLLAQAPGAADAPAMARARA